MEINELKKAIYEFEEEKARKSMDYKANLIIMHPEEYHDLMTQSEIFNWIHLNDSQPLKFMGIPIIRTTDIKRFEIR